MVAVVLVVAVLAATRTGGSSERVPTDAQARDLLARTYDRALREADAQGFCADNAYSPTCINHYLEAGGRQAVPTASPTVVGSRTMGSIRVLTVCGVSGVGREFRADFPVEWRNGTMRSILDVFWNSVTYHGEQADNTPIQATPNNLVIAC